MLTASATGLAFTRLFSVGSFSGISSSPVRPFDALGGWMVPTGSLQCGNRLVWQDSRGSHCNTDSLPKDPTCFRRVRASEVKTYTGMYFGLHW